MNRMLSKRDLVTSSSLYHHSCEKSSLYHLMVIGMFVRKDGCNAFYDVNRKVKNHTTKFTLLLGTLLSGGFPSKKDNTVLGCLRSH